MNTWTRVIKIEGQPNMTDVGDVKEDFFRSVLGDGLAQVEMTVGCGLDYGRVKVSATVRVTCNQDSQTINAVGERLFYKAHELAFDGMDLICKKEAGG